MPSALIDGRRAVLSPLVALAAGVCVVLLVGLLRGRFARRHGHSPRIKPQTGNIVEIARAFRKDMHNHVKKVEKHPLLTLALNA